MELGKQVKLENRLLHFKLNESRLRFEGGLEQCRATCPNGRGERGGEGKSKQGEEERLIEAQRVAADSEGALRGLTGAAQGAEGRSGGSFDLQLKHANG